MVITYPLINQEGRELPGRSGTWVKVNKVPESLGEDLLVEPNKALTLKQGITTGRAIVKNHGKVFITNMNREPKILRPGTNIGFIMMMTNSTEIEPELEKEMNLCWEIQMKSQINKNLSEEEQCKICEVLSRNNEVFAKSKADLGDCDLLELEIDTKDSPPLSTQPYKSAWKERYIVRDEVQKMIQAGVVKPSNSPWSAAAILVSKKDKTWRFCVDYRKLNKITTKDVYPLPRVEDTL